MANYDNSDKIGNQNYKFRKKDGRDKFFEAEGNEIFEHLANYLQYCQDNPIYTTDFIKAGNRAGEIIKIPKDRIPSVKGFCTFVGMTEQTFWNYEKDPRYLDFFESFAYVKECIKVEMQDAAISGTANPAITQLILELKNKTDITSNDETITCNIIFQSKPDTE